MLKFLLLVCLSCQVLGDSVTVTVNKLADKMLIVINGIIKAARRNIVYLDSTNLESIYSILLVKLPFNLRCWNGKIAALDSLRRRGDIIATRKGNVTTVRGQLEFGKLFAKYDNCSFNIYPAMFQQDYLAEIVSNRINFRATFVTGKNSCTSNLDNIELRELGKFRVERKNDLWNTFGGHFLIGRITPSFRREMVLNIDDLIRKEIPKINLCKTFKLVNTINKFKSL